MDLIHDVEGERELSFVPLLTYRSTNSSRFNRRKSWRFIALEHMNVCDNIDTKTPVQIASESRLLSQAPISESVAAV